MSCEFSWVRGVDLGDDILRCVMWMGALRTVVVKRGVSGGSDGRRRKRSMVVVMASVFRGGWV